MPEDPGRRAYTLLLETMHKAGHAAVAKIAMHQREYIVIIRPRQKGLTLHTMYYPNEVRAVPEWERIAPEQVRPQEVELARRLVESLSAPFRPEKYHDEYRKRVIELIEATGQGEEVKETPHKRMAPVIDLMAALQQSLADAGKKKPAAKAQPSKAPAAKGRKMRKAG